MTDLNDLDTPWVARSNERVMLEYFNEDGELVQYIRDLPLEAVSQLIELMDEEATD